MQAIRKLPDSHTKLTLNTDFMKIFRFPTNIESTENLQQVSKIFTQDRRIISFKLNSAEAKGMMEVSCNEDISEQEVKEMIRKAGFDTSTGFAGNA
jgi:hypothetical protein